MVLKYWTSKISDDQASNIAGTFSKVISAIINDPNMTVDSLDPVSERDKNQMIEWNAHIPELVNETLHNLISQKAALQPNRPAICSWDGDFTYRELDELSTILAHRLVDLGAGPETVVACCFDKSAWATVSILSILKSGAAFVFVDPTHPASRIKTVLLDAKVKIILVSPQYRPLFEGIVPHIIPVTSLLLKKAIIDVEKALPVTSPSNPAFVIFTSGSTGKPKGIVIEHKAIATSAMALINSVQNRKPNSRILQFASYVFDVSIGDIIITLMCGGCICVLSDYDRMNNIAGAMTKMGVNWAHLTPTVASMLRPEDVPNLKTLVVGGEAVTREIIQRWTGFPGLDLIICYGNAECSITTAGNGPAKPWWNPSNVGRSIGCVFWVVDPDNHDKLVPIGCVGELCIEGHTLARGYLNDAERTTTSFIENPTWLPLQSPAQHRRLYRTGDLAKQNSDGTFTIVGRKDTQVKLRGQRIETGEIEYHIRILLPEAKYVAVEIVAPRSRSTANQMLAAFITLGEEAPVEDPDLFDGNPDNLPPEFFELKTSLSERLPSYMIPSLFVPLHRMPRNTSGKLDRGKLRQALLGLSEEQLARCSKLQVVAKRAPSTKTEHQLQSLWAEVLGTSTDAIGADDIFFRLGGDSIAAMKLVTFAQAMGVSLTVADIFQTPQLCKMAEIADKNVKIKNLEELRPFSLMRCTKPDELLRQAALFCEVEVDQIEDIYPCTPLQEGLVAITTIQQNAYVNRLAFRIPESLDLERFREAWQIAVKHNSILRTRVVHLPSFGSFQIVLNESILWTTGTSLDEYFDRDKEVALTPGGPLVRFGITINSLGERHFILSAHHAVYDGWSLSLLFEQVAQIFNRSQMSPRIPFNRFISYLTNINSEASSNFWREQLSGQIPSSFPQLPTASFKPNANRSHRHSIDVSRKSKSTIVLSTIIRGAWALLLGSYTHSEDVIFGETLSGRNAPVVGITQIPGPTTTTVPLRVRFDHKQSIGDFLLNLQQTTVSMMPFEHTGLQRIKQLIPTNKEALDLRNLLVIQPLIDSDSQRELLDLEPVPIEFDGFSTYPLVLLVNLNNEKVQIEAQYDNRVLSTAQVRKLLFQLEHIIQKLSEGSEELTLGNLDLLGQEDLQQLQKWNNAIPETIYSCVHEVIEKQILSQPEAIAVHSCDGDFTYRELGSLSTRLANHLASLGVKPEVMVPVCFEKSSWAIVGMLAVLKAGGAFVPLSPSNPDDYLRNQVDTVKAKVFLVSARLQERFASIAEHVVLVSRSTLEALPEVATSTLQCALPSNAMYTVFTSGTTGQAKGVVLEHAAVSSGMMYHGRAMGFSRATRAFQFSSFVFDAAIQEIFTTLYFGGCVCVPSEEQRTGNLAEIMSRLAVNWTFMTPTVARIIGSGDVACLSTVVLGGEAVGEDNIRQWSKRVNLIGGYGPTECCICCACGPLGGVNQSPANIGKAIGSLLWIVDPDNENCLSPLGCIGELLVEGPVLARGYINDPLKTRAAFVENLPWQRHFGGTEQPRRLYKTGDLVKYNINDGTIEYVGRKDTQVKLSGQRIELGEIEHHVRSLCPQAKQVAVEILARPGSKNKQALAAFISLDDRGAHQVEIGLQLTDELKSELLSLKAALAATLPPYMVPSIFIPLHQMPLSTSGKLDRKKLQQLGAAELQLARFSLADESKRAPSTDIESKLQRLWAEALGTQLDQIGADDSFFRLGGDSIVAIQLASAAQTQGLNISVSNIFEKPQLSSMALAITLSSEQEVLDLKPFGLLSKRVSLEDVLIEAASQCQLHSDTIEDAYPCTPLQEGLISLSTRGHNQGSYMAQMPFLLPKSLDVVRFCQAWQTVVNMHPILRTRIIYSEILGSLQVVIRELISWNRDLTFDDYLKEDMATPMSHGKPLARFAIVDDQQHNNYFVWTAHHSIYDGWSVGMVFNHVEQVYHQHDVPTPVPFKAFIHYLESADAEKSAIFWRSQFSGDDKPASFPELPSPGYEPLPDQRCRHSLQISKNPDSDITISTALRAAWGILLARHTDAHDIVFGSPLSGRNAPVPGIVQLCGPVLTTVPLRIKIDQEQLVTSFLKDVQEQAVHMIPFEHTGIQNIRRILGDNQGLVDIKSLFLVQPAVEDTTQHDLLGLKAVSRAVRAFGTYALTLTCSLSDGKVDVQAQYDKNVIPPRQMELMLYQFEHVAQQLLKDSEGKLLNEIEIFSPYDSALLMDWNKALPEVVDSCVHTVISQRVSRQPHAPAICGWDGDFSYGELDEVASMLARHLVGLGAGPEPETNIALCFDKSVWAIVAMLAILKSGATCIFVDPKHPRSRLSTLTREANVRIVLVSPQYGHLFDSPHVVPITASFFQYLVIDDYAPLPIVRPTAAAFVIFTSGSTGKPKGIVLEHRSLCSGGKALLNSVQRRKPRSRVLQYAAYVFDVSIGDIIFTLMCGGCICVLSEDDRMNDVSGAIRTMKVDWAHLTPTVASILKPTDVPGLKTLVLGGEAVTKELVNTWAPEVNLIICYGNTECSVTTAGRGPAKLSWNPSNIGRPIGYRFWVAEPSNPFNLLAPLGCVGELFIDGPGVARGYLNDPERTRASFVEPPAWARGGEVGRKLYRTGDLVRYNPDGTLTYVGRKDTQIKLHGQRIELGEVEFNVRTQFAKAEQVAAEIVTRLGTTEMKMLAVFFTIKRDERSVSDRNKRLNGIAEDDIKSLLAQLSDEDQSELFSLQTGLADKLPPYMVPSLFVPLWRLPLNASGKTDRGKLRQLILTLSETQLARYSLADVTKKAPSTQMELRLQALWAEILGLDREFIGADDSFLRLGGDSIGAMRLVATARNNGLSLSVADIFQAPQLSRMAQVMENSTYNAQPAELLQPFDLVTINESLEALLGEAAKQCESDEQSIEDIYPCTPLQEGLIVLSTQYTGAYLAQMAFQLPKSLDLERFKQAWQHVVNAHPILRTRIIYYPKASQSLQIVLRDSISWKSETNFERYLKTDKSMAVAYGAPLARFAMINDSSNRYFVWTAHHSIYDGWSTGLVFDHVQRIYHGQDVPKPVAFNSFIQYLQSVDGDATGNFWRSQLSGDAASTFPQLPLGYRARPNQSLSQSLKLTRPSGSDITVPTVLRAAWAIVMANCTSADDVIFGAALSGRNVPVQGIEQISGPTVTTVPVRVKLDGTQSASEFLHRIQDQATDMIPFEHTGLQNIRRQVGSDHAPHFNNLFVVQPAIEKQSEQNLLGLTAVGTDLTEFGTYALTTSCSISDNMIGLEMQFDETVIPVVRVELLLHQLEHVIQQLIQGSEMSSIQAIDMFGAEDGRRITQWQNDIPETIPTDACIHDLIHEQALSQPNAPAVCAWDTNLTYHELEDLSSRLAYHLTTLGVRPEVKVPVCFDKSAWTIVSILAILKAGGAYVSLDPSHPVSRLDTMITRVDATVILTAPQHAHLFDKGICQVLPIDRTWLGTLPSMTFVSSPKVLPNDLAFVVFTSGSTGTPKGVELLHRSMCTMARTQGPSMGFTQHTRALQWASSSFDVSNSEILTTLIHGGCVCVPSEYDRVNNLVSTITAMNVNWLFLTPTVAELLDPNSVPTLRTLALGGEAINTKLASRWMDKVCLINSYGPSECTIWASMSKLDANVNPTNIGRGLGSRMWIAKISNHDQLAPIGCVGELLLEGPTLARGYINDDEKTGASFIHNPAWSKLAGNEQRRFYKTGDLVKYDPRDGTMEFVGRKDNQIKLHGQRIELGEIEHHIQVQDGIESAMVIVPKVGPCKNQLAALVTLDELSSQSSDPMSLCLIDDTQYSLAAPKLDGFQEQLSQHVPEYMNPSIWIMIKSFPLTSSGKMDRLQTTKWVEQMPDVTYRKLMDSESSSNERALTEMETRVQAVWSDVLNIPVSQISPSKSFLRLGGDSITAMQVVSKCRTESIFISVQDILRIKTIAGIAVRAEVSGKTSISMDEDFDTTFDLSPIQTLYFDRIAQPDTTVIGANAFNQSVLLKLSRHVPVEDLEHALNAVAIRHSMLRARFIQDHNGRWSQLVMRETSGSYSFAVHDVGQREEIGAISRACQTSLNIQTGPVFAAQLYNLPAAEQSLFLTAHHLVIDLVSWRIILRDVEAILDGQSLAREKPLPFQTWCKLQADYTTTHILPEKALPMEIPAADFNYWGMKDHVNIRADAISDGFSLQSEITDKLFGKCNDALHTEPVEIILAALAYSFNLTFQDRSLPAIYNEGHGREPWDAEIDLSETVGWFTTMTPIHVPISTTDGIIQTIRLMKDTRRRIPNKGQEYFASRFLTNEGKKLFGGHSDMEILFNFGGRYQQLERDAALFRLDSSEEENGKGAPFGAKVNRLALFDISANVGSDGLTHISMTFNRHMRHQDLVRDWLQRSKLVLERAVEKLEKMQREYTLADFPLLSLRYNDLEELKNVQLPQMNLSSFDEVEDMYPCTPMQQGILLTQIRSPEMYKVRLMGKITTGSSSRPVNVQQLANAWQNVVKRHASLRTVFVETQSEKSLFNQVVLKEYNAPVLSIQCQDDDAAAMINRIAPVQYNYTQPPHRLTLAQSPAGNVYSLLEISHALTDASSTALLMRDFFQAYENNLVLEPRPLYCDYVAYLQKQHMHEALNYWKGFLAGVQPCHFPFLQSKEISTAPEQKYQTINVDIGKAAALHRFCGDHGVTVANILKTAWSLVLRTYTGSDSVSFGYLASGRDVPVPGIDDTIGLFINMLVCCVNVDKTTSVLDIIRKVQEDFLHSLPYQHCSLAEIQHALKLSGQQLFNTSLSFQRGTSDSGADTRVPSILFEKLAGQDPAEVKPNSNHLNMHVI